MSKLALLRKELAASASAYWCATNYRGEVTCANSTVTSVPVTSVAIDRRWCLVHSYSGLKRSTAMICSAYPVLDTEKTRDASTFELLRDFDIFCK